MEKMNKAKFRHLNMSKREVIENMLKKGHTKKDIASAIGCSERTIYYEIKRGLYKHIVSSGKKELRYAPETAELKYQENLRQKGRKSKLKEDSKLKQYIHKKITEEKYSPEAVLLEIQRENKEFDIKVLSKNSIYLAIRKGYFQGITMEKLPQHRKRLHEKIKITKRLPKGTSIEQRPAKANSREEFGHWEMDCMQGKKDKGKVALVLTERKTRFEIVEIMKNQTVNEVTKALNRIEKRLFSDFYKIFKTITVDCGSEFKDQEKIEKALYRKGKRTNVHYCHPYTPSERGSNEVNNQLLRRWFPKSSDFNKVLKRNKVKLVQHWMNNYPRKQFQGFSSQYMFNIELEKLRCKYRC